jgi:hypothetical protein
MVMQIERVVTGGWSGAGAAARSWVGRWGSDDAPAAVSLILPIIRHSFVWVARPTDRYRSKLPDI